MLSRLAGYLSVFSAFTLIVACIKIFLYYRNFQVSINEYVGISELIITVAGDLLLAIPFVILYAILGYHGERKADCMISISEANVSPQLLKKQKTIGLLIQIILFIALTFFFFKTSRFGTKIQIGAVIVLFIYSFYSRYAKSLDSDYLKNELNRALGFSSIFLFLWLIFTGADIKRVENGKYLGTKIVTKDSVYISTKDHYFIGKTEKYIFIYNANDTTTKVLRGESIESITLKER